MAAFNLTKQSRTDGGTSHILPLERKKATFNIEIMTNILDGGKEFTTKRRWIQNSHDDAFEDNDQEDRIGQVEIHADLPRGQIVAQSMKHFMDVHWEHLERGYRPKGQDMTFMSGAKFGNTGPLSLHYGVFMSTMRSQTSAEQREWWVEAGMKLNFIGCYAQTELGHGSNVRGLQTTATFNPAPAGPNGDGEWIMNSPTLQSAKWWSTGMYSATHAAVYAQMILNNKPMGVHVFFVQLRGSDLKPLKGIDMGDIGPKLGDNDTPIGYLRMNQVSIPRRHLMEARSHVLSNGTYISGPPAPPVGSKAEAALKEKAARKNSSTNTNGDMKKKTNGKAKSKGKNVSHYITMLKTRIGLTNTAGSAIAKACVIAARYSAVRLQGFQVGSNGILNSPESQILDYQNQLFRILQWTSHAYAIKFVARWLLKKRKDAEANMKSGNDDANKDLPEVHSSAAGLKALCCCMAADGIEDLRRACGGHGYMMSSGIAPLEADFKGPNTTAEGDYVVLALQTAKFLIKSVQAAKSNDELPGTTKILKPLGNKSFDPYNGDGKPIAPEDLAAVLCGSDMKSEAITSKYLKDLFAYRSLVKCEQMASHYEGSYVAATKAGQKDPTGIARNENARTMQTAALSHVRYFVVEKYFEEVESVPADSAERRVLHRLGVIYALSDVVGLQGNGPSWGGLLDSKEVNAFEYAVDRLMKMLRPDVIALVESFDISDTILNSALGSSDGKVYEKLFNAAENSAMNVDDEGERVEVPECLLAVDQYISRDFLRTGRLSKDDIGKVGGAKISTQFSKGKL